MQCTAFYLILVTYRHPLNRTMMQQWQLHRMTSITCTAVTVLLLESRLPGQWSTSTWVRTSCCCPWTSVNSQLSSNDSYIILTILILVHLLILCVVPRQWNNFFSIAVLRYWLNIFTVKLWWKNFFCLTIDLGWGYNISSTADYWHNAIAVACINSWVGLGLLIQLVWDTPKCPSLQSQIYFAAYTRLLHRSSVINVSLHQALIHT